MISSKQNQDVVHQARLNKIIFFWPILLAIAAVAIAYHIPTAQQASIIFIGVAIIWILMTWVTYLFSSLTIKSKRIILRTGMIVRQTVDIPIDKVESIDIRQSIIGSLLRYGSLVITGTGGTRHFIGYLNQPLNCRHHIERLMHQPN